MAESSPSPTSGTGLNIIFGLRTFDYNSSDASTVDPSMDMNTSSENLSSLTMLGSDGNGTDSMEEVTVSSGIEQIPFASAVILIILYTLTTLAAVLGNALAIVVFTKGKRSNTDLRLFLINLAVADLIMAIFCIPFTFAYQISGNWIFTNMMCPIVQCCQVVSVTASVSTNTAIGIDRLVAVKFPLRKRVTTSKSKLVILCIWIFAMSMGIIPLIKSRTNAKPDGRVACEEDWSSQNGRLAYSFIVMIITYFLPVTILSVTYTMIGRQLWLHKLPGNADDHRDAAQLKSKRKVVKMLATIVLLFGVCWLPLHLFMIIFTFNETAFGGAVNEVYFGVHWLSMANSFVNPVVYGFMNDNFRADLKNLAESCLCWPWSRRRLKYRPAAMRWKLGDCNVHDVPHSASHGYTLSRYEMQHKNNTPHQQRLLKNGHANSAPSFDVAGICTCDLRTDSTMVCGVSPNKGRYVGGNVCGHGGGRNIFLAGKRRHYEPCRNESSRPNSTEENGILMMKKKRQEDFPGTVQGNGRLSGGCDAHPSVLFDGSNVRLVTESHRQEHG